MNSKIKTVLILSGLFLIVSLFWVMIGNFLFDSKPVIQNKEEAVTTFKKVTINLMVENVNRSIEFYKDTLEFKVTATLPDSGNYEFAIMNKDDVEIMLQSMSSMPEDIRHLWGDTIGGSITLYYEIESIDEYYNRVKEKCEIIHDMNETFYGMKEFTIRDNNGYLLTFAEEIKN